MIIPLTRNKIEITEQYSKTINKLILTILLINSKYNIINKIERKLIISNILFSNSINRIELIDNKDNKIKIAKW